MFKHVSACVAAAATLAVTAVPVLLGAPASAAGSVAGDGTASSSARAATKHWQLRYSTDFSNLAGWTVYNNQTQNNDNSVNMAKNVSVGSNGLTIVGKKESGASMPYTTGEIVGKSANQVVGNYFKARVTGKFEDLQGVWPCLLWFRPNNASDGEIDVMEWMGGLWSGDQKRVAITMHNEYGATQDSIKKPLLLKSNSWYDSEAVHTYVVKKVPGSITVKVDGRVTSKFTSGDKAWWNRIMENSNRTWYPRITLQIGAGSVTKTVPNPTSSFSSTKMNVKSFKLWNYVG